MRFMKSPLRIFIDGNTNFKRSLSTSRRCLESQKRSSTEDVPNPNFEVPLKKRLEPIDIQNETVELPKKHVVQRMIVTESPFKNDGSIFTKFKRAIGIGDANIIALRRASVFHYEACTDKLNAVEFFRHLQLPDTVFSFFLIVQLHVWMCQARSMCEGPEGRRLRNEISERMWQDWDTRLKKVEIHAFNQRKSVLTDLLFHHQGAMLSYDEGLLTDDKTLAGAIWRTLFSKSEIEPHTLEMAVRYVRTQMNHLRSIGPRDWCLEGNFEWAPFPPLYNKPSK